MWLEEQECDGAVQGPIWNHMRGFSVPSLRFLPPLSCLFLSFCAHIHWWLSVHLILVCLISSVLLSHRFTFINSFCFLGVLPVRESVCVVVNSCFIVLGWTIYGICMTYNVYKKQINLNQSISQSISNHKISNL